MPKPSKRITGIVPSGKDGWEVHFAAWTRRAAGEDIIVLSVGDHDFDTPPQTIEACVNAVRGSNHHYTPLSGLPRLRKAMAAASSACTGVLTEPDEVIATAGGQGALYAAVQGVLDPGDHAIVVAPYYATYPNTFSAAGASFTVVETPAEDGFQPRADRIRAALRPNTRAILINTPNNPTGAVYSRERLEQLAEICKEHDLWLLSDEVYWTLGGGEHISPRSLPGMSERTLVINSMSKSHGMTGWRMGWLTGPKAMIALMTDLNLVTTYGLPAFISIACAEALENHYGVDEIAERYAGRRAVFLDAIRGANEVTVRGSEGGMYVMLDISAIEPDDEKFAWALLDKEKIGVMPGSSFGEAAAGHIRISLCQPEPVLQEAALRVRRFASDYRREAA
ncbi:MAG: pyridoxal phosphate-dependent aminotransferase [Mesorhizobium sp.]|uniref:pyridoxal phosphate-dependent aminotransferase n=1 Tax=unclassified Mesorhizobium TaxID=325217 RepID=UPI000FCBCAD8|nr:MULTISPECIES: pyridoxal phosphate-dependent aminotransferase [unclassified Mesorhizobium]RUV45460.1 pyridoxal phosphate-dependent aminotransferase [Mesorhizobium sp. M1A.T.Ca.IN.004.03.1.1]RWG21682.1 MAG: pyridoxal phosphate-dependent aminotransferase [Mesorhizobium sp.]RWI93241.1 MAG: pyridoxal phosphate-dependent aminotransferase [Mesorhizobium sp.]RWK39188.1 MAG: pyridoxal phosphate-dependent aminotransferase [Mesorhizobium sp.]RWK92655.1 MAG: pyridoxal phosphate-dependent aminotransfera